jgi:hypothetical protein
VLFWALLLLLFLVSRGFDMEYLVALLTLLAAGAYAVFIVVNVEKGKSWALEIAQAISAMDPNVLDRPMDRRDAEIADEKLPASAEPERLAA